MCSLRLIDIFKIQNDCEVIDGSGSRSYMSNVQERSLSLIRTCWGPVWIFIVHSAIYTFPKKTVRRFGSSAISPRRQGRRGVHI